MIDVEKIRDTQNHIFQELRNQTADRLDAVILEQTLQDQIAHIHRFVPSQGGEKSIFTFAENDLFNYSGSQPCEKQLQDYVGDILMENQNE